MQFIREMFQRPQFLAILVFAAGACMWLGFGERDQPGLGVLGVVILIILIAGVTAAVRGAHPEPSRPIDIPETGWPDESGPGARP